MITVASRSMFWQGLVSETLAKSNQVREIIEMLNPIFQLPVCLDENEEWKIDSNPPGEFNVIFYSQVGSYTLVSWEVKIGEEAIAGENLWYGLTPIASEGGQLQLYVDPAIDAKRKQTNIHSSDIWESIPFRSFSIPTEIAIALRKINNLRFL